MPEKSDGSTNSGSRHPGLDPGSAFSNAKEAPAHPGSKPGMPLILTIALRDCAADHRTEDSANHRARAAVAAVPASAAVAAAVVAMAIAAHCSAECRAGYPTGNGARGRIAALIAVIAVTIVAVAAVTIGGIAVAI